MVEQYEAMRETVVAGEGTGGLDVGLLMAKGMAAWITGWRACRAPVAQRPLARPRPLAARELIDVLAGMALACV